VSYGVPLYHFRAERQGGQEESRIKQRFSIITPEEEAASLCTPYPLKSKGPQTEQLQTLAILWSTFPAYIRGTNEAFHFAEDQT